MLEPLLRTYKEINKNADTIYRGEKGKGKSKEEEKEGQEKEVCSYSYSLSEHTRVFHIIDSLSLLYVRTYSQ